MAITARAPIPARTLRMLIHRADGRCEVCGGFLLEQLAPEMDDRGVTWSVQHRRPAGMGGTSNAEFNWLSNLLLVCGNGTTGCHGQIENEREWARDRGYLVWQSKDPKLESVLIVARGDHGSHGRVWLHPSEPVYLHEAPSS